MLGVLRRAVEDLWSELSTDWIQLIAIIALVVFVWQQKRHKNSLSSSQMGHHAAFFA